MSKFSRPDLAALALCALVIVAMTVCSIAHVATPTIFETLATIALSGGLGMSLNALPPLGRETITAPPTAPAPARSGVPAPRQAPLSAPAGVPAPGTVQV